MKALNTVNCKEKIWFAKSATKLRERFTTTMSPLIVHIEIFGLDRLVYENAEM